MDRYQRAWMESSASRGVHWGWRRRTLFTPDGYAADYNYPEWSVTLQMMDYAGVKMRKIPSPDWGMAVPVDYSSSPGVVFSLVGSFSRPLFRTGKWQMGYALEEGLAFCTQPYAKEHNIDNELTGGHWLIHFGASLYAARRLDKHWSLRGDLAFRHVSNGATYRPNKGLNAVLPTLSLQYDLDETGTPQVNVPKAAFAKGAFWRIGASVGVRTLIEDWLRSMPRPRPMLNTEQTISNAMRWPTYNWTVCIAMHEDGRRAWGPIFSTPLTCEHCKTEKCPKVLRRNTVAGREG